LHIQTYIIHQGNIIINYEYNQLENVGTLLTAENTITRHVGTLLTAENTITRHVGTFLPVTIMLKKVEA